MIPTIEQPNAAPALSGMRTMVLLCTYNEVENLPKLLPAIARHLPHADVLIVDDNSPDGSADWVRRQANYREHASPTARDAEAGLYLLHRAGKFGLGTATRAGLQWCLERDYGFVINMDADFSHDPALAPRLYQACASDGDLDVAVGSRYIAGGDMAGSAAHRRLMSRLLNRYATWLLRLPVHDCSGSFRCYRVSALRKLDWGKLHCPGYGFLEEILVALMHSGAVMREIPIQFQARHGGRSKLGWRDALGAITVIHQLALERRQSIS